MNFWRGFRPRDRDGRQHRRKPCGDGGDRPSDAGISFYLRGGRRPSQQHGRAGRGFLCRLRELAAQPKIVAIGEIGLDYYWDEPDRKLQKYWFRRQLNLARERRLPVVIHSRDAAKDTLDLMREERAEEIGGVIHCFSYGKRWLASIWKWDFIWGSEAC